MASRTDPPTPTPTPNPERKGLFIIRFITGTYIPYLVSTVNQLDRVPLQELKKQEI
jgi:hypothetical protein